MIKINQKIIQLQASFFCLLFLIPIPGELLILIFLKHSSSFHFLISRPSLLKKNCCPGTKAKVKLANLQGSFSALPIQNPEVKLQK